MIELYFWTTPNGMKPLILLEETGLAHNIQPVNISKGEHFTESFTRISPNQKIPAIVDHAPAGGGAPIELFESGAILQYLAEKTGQFLPQPQAERAEVMQWLFWQMAGLGPMLGQYLHFAVYADQAVPYAQGRYSREKERLYQVMDDRLRDREFLAGEYSIADIAAYPWIRALERKTSHLNGFANLQRWYEAVSERPAVVRAYERAKAINTTPTRSPRTPARSCWSPDGGPGPRDKPICDPERKEHPHVPAGVTRQENRHRDRCLGDGTRTPPSPAAFAAQRLSTSSMTGTDADELARLAETRQAELPIGSRASFADVDNSADLDRLVEATVQTGYGRNGTTGRGGATTLASSGHLQVPSKKSDPEDYLERNFRNVNTHEPPVSWPRPSFRTFRPMKERRFRSSIVVHGVGQSRRPYAAYPTLAVFAPTKAAQRILALTVQLAARPGPQGHP